MKTQILLTVIIVSVISTGSMAQNFDFRNTKWGMDTLQVKRAEISKLAFSKNNSLVYNGKLGDLDTRIVYDFNLSNQLCHTAYLIIVNSKNPQTYVSTFLLLQELLTKKYKEPYFKITSTINGKVINQDEWASNLISDNLNLETKWRSGKTDIVLSLFSINDILNIEINYTVIETDKKDIEEKNAEMLKGL